MSTVQAPDRPFTAPAIDDIAAIPLDALRAHPRNTRGKIKPADVTELAASIKACGLLQPLLVTPADIGETMFTIIAGHRRHAALQSLGVEQVSCRIVRGEPAELLAVMVVDNEQRTDSDPLLDAEVIGELLDGRGMSVSEVADALGKPVRWVARRANLRTLAPAARKAEAAGKLAGWSLRMFEDLAQLTAADQAEMVASILSAPWQVESEEDLSREIAERLHLLGKACWKLDDPLLVPKAGACSSCPKTSLHTPGLFDDDLDATDVTKATCRDRACWTGKRDAWLQRALATKRAETPDLLLVNSQESGRHDKGWLGKEEDSALASYDVKPVKKGTPGAQQAFIVNGKDAGTTQWVKVAEHAQVSVKQHQRAKAGGAKKDAGPTMSERRKGLALRRQAAVADAVLALVAGVDAPATPVVMGLAAAYGVYEKHTRHKDRSDAFDNAQDEESWGNLVFDRVRPMIVKSLRRVGSASDVGEFHDTAKWLCTVLHFDLAALEDEAAASLPEPKSWGAKDRAEEATKPKPAAKAAAGKGKAKGRAKRAGAA